MHTSLSKALSINRDAPVLIQARKGRFFVGTYNSYHSVVIESPTGWDDFKMVLTSEVSREMLKVLSKSVEFTVGENSAKVVTDGTRINLRLMDSRILTLGMLAQKFVQNETWKVEGEDLANAIVRVRHSANSPLIADIVMKGYHITHRPVDGNLGSLEVMATPGSSMSLAQAPLTGADEFGEKESTVIMNPEFHQVASLVDGGKVTVGLADGVDTASLTSEYEDGIIVRVLTALTKGSQIPYEPIVNELRGAEKLFEADRKEFLSAVTHTNFFSTKASSYKLDCLLAANKLVISATNDHGSTSTEVPVREQGQGMTFSISGDLLRTYLTSSKGKDIEVFSTTNTKPIMLKDGLSEEVISLYFS